MTKRKDTHSVDHSEDHLEHLVLRVPREVILHVPVQVLVDKHGRFDVQVFATETPGRKWVTMRRQIMGSF